MDLREPPRRIGHVAEGVGHDDAAEHAVAKAERMGVEVHERAPDASRRDLHPRGRIVGAHRTPARLAQPRHVEPGPAPHVEHAPSDPRIAQEADHLLDFGATLLRFVERDDPLRVVHLVGDFDTHARTSSTTSPTIAITSSTSRLVMRGKRGSEISAA